MWKLMTIVAMVISVVSCVLAVRAVRERDEAVRAALKQHEADLVQRYGPMVRQIARDAGMQNVMLNPRSIDDLIATLKSIAGESAEAASAANAAVALLEAEKLAAGVRESERDHAALNVRSREAARDQSRGHTPLAAAADRNSQRERATLDRTLMPEGDIAYSLRDRDGDSDLFLLRLPHGTPQRLTTGEWKDTSPIWALHGAAIAFVSDRDGQSDLYLLDRESGRIARLTESATTESSLTCSPDGQRIAFEVTGKEESGLRMIDLAGHRETTKLTDRGMSPSWSPDGSRIAFQLDAGVYLLQLSEMLETTRLVERGDRPAWSPDGERIAFTRLRGSPRDGWEFVTIRPDGTDERILCEMPARAGAPVPTSTLRWSPDGAKLLLMRALVPDDRKDTKIELALIDAGGGRAERPLASPNAVMFEHGWSPDGRFVLASGLDPEHDLMNLYAITTDGRYTTLATSIQQVQDASWIAKRR